MQVSSMHLNVLSRWHLSQNLFIAQMKEQWKSKNNCLPLLAYEYSAVQCSIWLLPWPSLWNSWTSLLLKNQVKHFTEWNRNHENWKAGTAHICVYTETSNKLPQQWQWSSLVDAPFHKTLHFKQRGLKAQCNGSKLSALALISSFF